ncbi:MAG: DUF2849 domain-containing protein [Alphaproteobacteria bacterium]|nr:DUF2849 domain-containing protein [Alphaproteobacteria bacterium]
MRILTGNDLKTGDVTWWTGTGWSRHVDEAVDAGADGEQIIARETAARNVNAAYVVEAEKDETGIRPAHIKDRIRAVGPTVRPDLGLKPADPSIGNWVI